MISIVAALREPDCWVPTLARRLSAGQPGPPLSLAKKLGPNEHLAHPRSGVPVANPELRGSRGAERDHARARHAKPIELGMRDNW